MFFTDSVATTVLCVFRIAAQMMNASGSSRRAASRTGAGWMSKSISGIVS
jgi:hypothetical protein